ncbi:hypothetical protein ABK040_007909 [Willaertia magna]
MSQFITLEDENQVLIIDLFGGGISKYYLKKDNIDIIYGYSSLEEKEAAMGDVLFPFPGRLEKFKYEYNNKVFQIPKQFTNKKGNLVEMFVDGNENALHGMVHLEEWKVDSQSSNKCIVSFENDKEYEGYPFLFKITLQYELLSNGFNCKVNIKNLSNETMPFGIGFHPYFSLSNNKDLTIDDHLSIKLNSNEMLEFDKELKPTGKIIKVNNELDLNHLILDNCYKLNTENESTTLVKSIELKSKLIKIELYQSNNFPYLQLYTFDYSNKGNKRKGIAIEPQTCCGFALNIGESIGLNYLNKNQEFNGQFNLFCN